VAAFCRPDSAAGLDVRRGGDGESDYRKSRGRGGGGATPRHQQRAESGGSGRRGHVALDRRCLATLSRARGMCGTIRTEEYGVDRSATDGKGSGIGAGRRGYGVRAAPPPPPRLPHTRHGPVTRVTRSDPFGATPGGPGTDKCQKVVIAPSAECGGGG